MKISKENAPHYVWGNACDGWRLMDNPELTIIHERMPFDTEEERHYHTKAKQFFFILSGTAVMEINGVRTILDEKEGLEVPPNVPHQIFNRSIPDLEFLVISQPSTVGDRIPAK